MSANAFPPNSNCEKERIAAYYDGDLSHVEERETGEHIAQCDDCSDYLKSLKMVATSLEIVLDKEPLKIPDEFSKRVTAAAESNMSGLRSEKEKSRAVAVSAVLLLAAAILVTMSATGLGPSLTELPSKLLAFAAMIGHLVYTAATGISMIFGTVCARVFFSSTATVIVVVGVLFLSILIFSKHILRFHRS